MSYNTESPLNLPSEGGRTGYQGNTGAGNVYHPPVDNGGGGAQQNDPFNGPGSVTFDLTDPQGSADKAAQESGDLFGGIKSFLFGTNTPDVKGHRGGLLNVGDVPILGDALRGGADVVGAAGGAAVGAVAGAVGGTLERIPGGNNDAAMRAAGLQTLQEQFDALPDDSPAKKAALAQMGKDKGLFGTGLLSGSEHYMSLAIQQHEDEAVAANPSLWSGLFRPSASLADTVSNLFGVLGASQRGTERLIAGAGRPGQGNLNQLQMIHAVGDGNAVWTADDPGLTPVEQTVYDKTKSGEWSETQALDYMASHGAGLAHSKALEIAGAFAADPLNVATLGAGALAKFGETGMLLSKTLTEAQAGLKAAEAAGDAEKVAQYTKAIEVASEGIKSGIRGEGVASRDVLGQLAKRKWTGDVARKYGQFYGELEGTSIGKVAKAARTVIDPMSAISRTPRGAAALEEGSADVTHAVVSAHGEFTHIDNTRYLRGLEGGEDLADQYNDGLAIYAGNTFRRVAGRQYRAVQMMMGAERMEALAASAPMKAIRDAVGGMKRRGLVQLEEEAGQFVKHVWTKDDDVNLAARASTLWGNRTAEDWTADLAKMSGPQKSLLHAATYGSAVKQLHAAKMAVRVAGQTGNFVDRMDDLVLLNRRTLTDLGHQGILDRITAKASNIKDQIAEIESARETYPELRSFPIDPTSDRETLNNFIEMMERRKHFLPAQIRDAERGGLPEALRDFDSLITPNGDPEQAVFTIGFRPKDEFLWGLQADSDGVLREVHDPWMDQASDNFQAYSSVREVPRNIAGIPIAGAVAQGTARALDFTEAVGRTALHGVTGKMVSQAAHVKFVENLAAKYVSENGTTLIDKPQAEAIWKTLMAKVDDSENISGMRGLSEDAIWRTADEVIPRGAKAAGLDRRALLLHVLDAYDGDVRYIGLTQKLTGRMKLALGHTFLGNTAGVVSEHAWPLLKFRLNPFFQLQEKIEPWVLSAQRGASVILGTKATDLDHATATVIRNFADRDLISIADNDIGELASKYLLHKSLSKAADQENGVLGKALSRFEGLADVQGSKQIAAMRTWRKGLGKTMRQSWDEAMPGEFDKMLDHFRALRGEPMDEDEFAVMLAHSNLAANDIPIDMVDGQRTMDFSNAILEGQWSAPQHLGELQPLNLDYNVRRLGLRADIKTNMDLRRALADNTITLSEVSRALREQLAHPDYISRVESALSFSYPEFFKSVQETYALTDAQRLGIEGMFRRIATKRGMTPVEYLSQVYSPQIGRGTEASVGSLGELVGAMRNGLPTPDLAQLRGIPGQSGIQDFYQQAGAIMAHHLDPSAKRAFLEDLMGSGNAPNSITDIMDTWDQLGATEQMSNRVMQFLQGAPGTGPHTPVTNEATGLASIRNLAKEYRDSHGRPRNLQRTIHDDAPDVQRDLADALDGMTEEYTHVATQADLAKPIEASEVARISRLTTPGNVKSEDFRGLSQDAQHTIEARMLETRRLYGRITKPVSEGGLGIRVQYTTRVPYASADALRADLTRGVIKVPKSGYWHPVIHNEDLAMERVVQDVFGHGQEANALGSHDAIMSAAAMYSDETRGSVLTDGFARNAWEKSSQQVIPPMVAEPTNIAEYEARWGGAADRPENMATTGLSGNTSVRQQTRTLGTNIRGSAPEVQHEAISTLGSIRNQFPGIPLDAVDFGDIPAVGMTLDFELEHPTIVLDTKSGWQSDATERAATRAQRQSLHVSQAGNTHILNRATGRMEPRQSFTGVPMFTSATPTGDLYHEFGHAVDLFLHKRARVVKPGSYGSTRLTKFMRDFKGSPEHQMLSEYAFNKSDHALKDSDMFAELFDLAFNPEQEETLAEAGGSGATIFDSVHEFRRILRDEGIWHPDGAPLPAQPHAGMTVGAANAGGAGIRAPFKKGTLPQDALDKVTGHFIGSGRYAESNPDVGRIAAYFHQHMADLTEHTLEHGTGSQYAHLFDGMSGMPVTDAVPFDATRAALWHASAQLMAGKWEDAFRLQYFAQNRSMLQRSINHPMFGLYPASYMWGKIGPEMIRFIASEPFGMKTGAMAYSLGDLQKAIAIQRKYDPKFEKGIEGIGHSAALDFLGYMLPATPWDVPASYPAWLRNMAQQGLENQKRADRGGLIKNDDFVAPLMDTIKKVFPMQTQVPFLNRALGDAGNVLPWNQKQAPVSHPFDPTGETLFPAGAPADNAPASAPAQTGALPAPASPQSASLSAPVNASELTAVLPDTMRSLMDALSGV